MRKTTKTRSFCRFRNPKRISKKASLSLSVNAIVVLILAITLLGLGLGFIRGMFGKVSTQVKQQISAETEPSIPSPSNTITLSREIIITHADEDEVVKVSVYNPTNGPWTAVTPEVTCSDMTGFGTDTQTANSRNIDQGTYETFSILLDIPQNLGANTYLCQVSIEDYQKDLAIKIVQ